MRLLLLVLFIAGCKETGNDAADPSGRANLPSPFVKWVDPDNDGGYMIDLSGGSYGVSATAPFNVNSRTCTCVYNVSDMGGKLLDGEQLPEDMGTITTTQCQGIGQTPANDPQCLGFEKTYIYLFLPGIQLVMYGDATNGVDQAWGMVPGT